MRATNGFLRALGSSMGSRLGIGVMNYGLFWALSHLLDGTGLGGFSLLTNAFFAVQTLPLLGLGLPFIRRVATGQDDLPREVTGAFVFALPISLLLALLLGLWGQFSHEGALTLPFWLVAASALPAAWNLVAESTLIGRERFGDMARINLVETVMRALLAVTCVRFGYGLTGVFAVFLVLRVMVAIVYALHPALPLPRWHLASSALQRRNWRELPVFFFIVVVTTLLLRLDVVVLSYLRGLVDVAVYAAASRLYEAAQVVPTVLALVVIPLLARQFVAARAQFAGSLAVAIRMTLTLGLAVALPAIAFADSLVHLLYKPEMAAAAGVLRWLAFGAVLMVTDVILSSTMLAASAQRKDLQALAVNLAVLSVGLFLLIPPFGIQGAAAAVVLGICTRLLLRLHWTVTVLGLPRMEIELVRLAGATAFGIVVERALATSAGPWLASLAALAVYFAVVLLTGGFGRRPLLRLRGDLAVLLQHPAA